MPSMTVPTITLNDRTDRSRSSASASSRCRRRRPPRRSTQALEVGYRHIDTAQMYQNEQGVGEAITASGIARDELYITSKLNNGFHRPDDARRAFDETLAALGLDRIDLFLIHWPLPTLYDGDFVSTWRTLAEFVEDGRATSIGVSNFQPAHLDRIVAETGVVPAVNQIEVHPYFTNEAARAASHPARRRGRGLVPDRAGQGARRRGHQQDRRRRTARPPRRSPCAGTSSAATSSSRSR